jgi:cardiolipin synthase
VEQWTRGLGAIGIIVLVLLTATILIAYFRGTFRRRVGYSMMNVPQVQDDTFFLVLPGLASSLPTQAQPTDFLIESDALYAARLKAIQSAQQTIHFETFYMTPGKRADDFAVAIAERARSGVQVQLNIDAHGSRRMPHTYWQFLRSAGVELGFFQTFTWKAPLDYNARTHRKMLLIDGEVALVGGAGVSDEWDGKSKTGSSAPWRDFEVRYEGALVTVLEGVFMENWARVAGKLNLSSQVFRHLPVQGQPAFVTTGNFSIQDSALRILFHTSILAAQQRLWIGSPYLVPDRSTRRALIRAAQRGVDVRILTMGVHNDKPFVYYTARELYQDLLEGGVRIYEYQPNMMHAKVLLVDDRWVSHGSTNLDERSFFINDELNVSVSDCGLATQIEKFLIQSFANSVRITPEQWQQRPLWQRARGQFGLIFRLLF